MAEMEKRRRRASAEVGMGETAEVEQQETEIDLLELFYNLLENWKLLAAAVIAGALIMALISLLILTPIYEATAKLYVMPQSDSAINVSDLQIGKVDYVIY